MIELVIPNDKPADEIIIAIEGHADCWPVEVKE